MTSPTTSTRAPAIAAAGNFKSGAFKFFQSFGDIGFPGIAARALPIESLGPEAAGAAGITPQTLGLALDQAAHQTGVRFGNPVLTGIDISIAHLRRLSCELRLQQAVQAEQQRPALQ